MTKLFGFIGCIAIGVSAILIFFFRRARRRQVNFWLMTVALVVGLGLAFQALAR